MKKLYPVVLFCFSLFLCAACSGPDTGEALREAPREVTAPAGEDVLTPAETEAPDDDAAAPATVFSPDPSRGRAPDFTLAGPDGREITLSESLGAQATLIVFWATWCGPCVRAIPAINEFYVARAAEIESGRLALYSINVRENAQQVRAAVERHGMNYPVLLDHDGSVTGDFGVRGIPTVYLVDREMGVIDQGHVFSQMVSTYFAE